MIKKRIEEQRMKTGRSNRCLDCKKNRCVIESCQCSCHRDFANLGKPRITRHYKPKKEFKT